MFRCEALTELLVLVSCIYNEQIDKVKLEVQPLHEVDIKRAIAGPSMGVNLDIPESIGLSAPLPGSSTSRLVDFDIGRRGKRKV